MNEELQSANAEQEDVNRELMLRTEEIEQLNSYLQSILASLTMGVAVVNADLEVHLWNEQAFDIWGLRADEVVGRSLLSLDIGLDVEQLSEPLQSCLAGQAPQETVLPAINRRGRRIVCRVLCTPLMSEIGRRQGAVILMETALQHEQDLAHEG